MKKILIAAFIALFSTGVYSVETANQNKPVDRVWVRLYEANPSIWADVNNMKITDDEIHITLMTKFGSPQKLHGFTTPSSDVVTPFTGPVMYVLTPINVLCKGGTYTINGETFFGSKDEIVGNYVDTEKVPTTIDNGSVPDLVRQRFCK